MDRLENHMRRRRRSSVPDFPARRGPLADADVFHLYMAQEPWREIKRHLPAHAAAGPANAMVGRE